MQVAGSLVLPSYATEVQAPQTSRRALKMVFDVLFSNDTSWQLDFSKFACFHAQHTPRDSSIDKSSGRDNQNIGIILLSLVFGIC